MRTQFQEGVIIALEFSKALSDFFFSTVHIFYQQPSRLLRNVSMATSENIFKHFLPWLKMSGRDLSLEERINVYLINIVLCFAPNYSIAQK